MRSGVIVQLLSCILVLGIVSSCGKSEQQQEVEAKKTGLFVINVLDKPWYDDCHIKGSISVSLDELDAFVSHLDPEKAEVVLYCSNYFCTSSGHSCKRLKEMGFKHVWAYEGGSAEWFQMGLPVEGACQRPYLSKKLMPSIHEEGDQESLITADELAHKMGLK